MGKDSKDTFAVDTRNRSLKQWGEGLFALFVGLTIAHLGVSLFLVSELGSDAFTVMIQGIATSIDALSVGFTIADYDLLSAAICAFIIAVVTFIICMGGLVIGKGAGTKLSGKATILGGVILIFIGLEIFITGVF